MGALVSAGSTRVAISGWWRSKSATRVLLAGGVVAGVLYAIGDVVSGIVYDGYSFRDQAISELTAVGSPVRPLMVATMVVHSLPLLAFAAGIWRLSDRKSVRGISVALIAATVAGIPNHTAWAMSSRWLEPGFNDTMHQTLSSIWGVLIVVAVALSAVAFNGRFRVYGIATIPLIIGFAAASVAQIQGIEQNQTPWAGAFERVSAYACFAWLAVLAIVAIRRLDDYQDLGAAPSPRRLTTEGVWREIAKSSFAVIGYVTPAGEPRTSGVSFKSAGHRLFMAVDPDSWKARHIEAKGRVSVTVPVRRGGLLTLLLPIPPATLSFHAEAIVHPACPIDESTSLPKELVSLLPVERQTVVRVIELRPEGEFLTYGLGVSLMDMKRPAIAQGRVAVA